MELDTDDTKNDNKEETQKDPDAIMVEEDGSMNTKERIV